MSIFPSTGDFFDTSIRLRIAALAKPENSSHVYFAVLFVWIAKTHLGKISTEYPVGTSKHFPSIFTEQTPS